MKNRALHAGRVLGAFGFTLVLATPSIAQLNSTKDLNSNSLAQDTKKVSSVLKDFIQDWYQGFDEHQEASFFTRKLAADGFEIHFPGQEPIETVGEFRSWLKGVDYFTSVSHEVKDIQLLSENASQLKVAIRVDWSAMNGSQYLFFPAYQEWTLVKHGDALKIKKYEVSEAKVPNYKRNKDLLSQYIENFYLLHSNRQQFEERQQKLVSENVTIFHRSNGNEFLYEGFDGFLQSVDNWGQRFSFSGEPSIEWIRNSDNQISIRFKGTIHSQGTEFPPDSHCWTQTFGIDASGKISAISEMMNFGKMCQEATDRNGLNAVMRAAANGNLYDLKQFTKENVALGLINYKGASALYYAAQNPDLGLPVFQFFKSTLPKEQLEKLLNAKVIPNKHSIALEAVFNGNADVIDFLLNEKKNGMKIDFHSPTVFGWTPKTFAEREKMPFAQLLPEGDVLVEDRQNFLARMEQDWLASLREDQRKYHQDGLDFIRSAKQLDLSALEAQQSIDLDGKYGRLGATILNSLAEPGLDQETQKQRAQVLVYLLQRGANPLLEEEGIMQVPHGFREAVFGYPSMLKVVIDSFENDLEKSNYLNVRGPINGYTKLIDAAMRGRINVINLLIDSGADLRIQGYNGLTALQAAKNFNQSVVASGDLERKIPEEVISKLQF